MGGTHRVTILLASLALLAPGTAAASVVVGAGTTFDDTTVAWGTPATQAPQPPATPFAAGASGPVSVATDRLGTEYAAWSDGHHVWEAHSSDAGATWSPPARVDIGSGTAILPVVLVGEPGRVAVAYYKTPYANGDAPAWSFPVDAVWWVAVAENMSTLSGRVFAENRATSAVHYGAGPTLPLALSLVRATGLAVLTYPSDQFDPAEQAPPQCNASTANTSACLHTMQALQTSGPRLVSPPAARVKAAKKTLRRQRH